MTHKKYALRKSINSRNTNSTRLDEHKPETEKNDKLMQVKGKHPAIYRNLVIICVKLTSIIIR